MKKNKLKKLFYLLSLSSVLSSPLTLTGCNTSNETEEAIETEENLDVTIAHKCLEEHIDIEGLLDKKEELSELEEQPILPSDIPDASIIYALRERFLNNNRLYEVSGFPFWYHTYALNNENKYLYSYFDNMEIRYHIAQYVGGILAEPEYDDYNISNIGEIIPFYKENNLQTNVRICTGFVDENANSEYILEVDSDLVKSEQIKQQKNTDVLAYSKYLYCHKLDESTLLVSEQYSLSSVERSGLNKIKIDVKSSYTLDTKLIIEGIYTCDNHKSTIVLRKEEEVLEIVLTEEQFNTLTNLITESVKEDKSVPEFIESNSETLNEILGEEYIMFIQGSKIKVYQ